MFIKSALPHFLELFFPRICVVCSEKLISQEEFLCMNCQFNIPRTRFHEQPDNLMEQLFYGRVQIERATAFFEFQKGSDYQKILHQLKYKGLNQLGIYMGKLFGFDLQNTGFTQPIDLICPVPLHPKKEKKRGYNQSLQIAMGLSEVLNIPVDHTSLWRVINTKTQTRKNRFERWENVDGIFEVVVQESIRGKHILLVDDVVTTGSTFEALANAVHKKCDVKISLLTLAIA